MMESVLWKIAICYLLQILELPVCQDVLLWFAGQINHEFHVSANACLDCYYSKIVCYYSRMCLDVAQYLSDLTYQKSSRFSFLPEDFARGAKLFTSARAVMLAYSPRSPVTARM